MLCCGSSQILESVPWFLLRIRSVLSKSDEMVLRNSDQIMCFVMWGSSILKTALQIQVLWKFIYIVLLILAKISPWPYFFQDECKSPQIPSKSSQNALRNLQNPPEILPKSISDGTRSPLGDYVEPLIEKNSIFNAKEVAQRRSGASGEAKMEWNLRDILTFFSFFFAVIFQPMLDSFFEAPNLKKVVFA